MSCCGKAVATHAQRKKKNWTRKLKKEKKTQQNNMVAKKEKKTSKHCVLMPRLSSQKKHGEYDTTHPAAENLHRYTKKEDLNLLWKQHRIPTSAQDGGEGLGATAYPRMAEILSGAPTRKPGW